MIPVKKQDRIAIREAQLDTLRVSGWRIITDKRTGAVVAYDPTTFSAKGWKAGAARHAFYYRFRDAAHMEKYVSDWLDSLAAWKAARSPKPGANAADHYAVGDVLENSWGYDQTNVDWYQVTRVSGKTIWIRPIAHNCSDYGGAQGGKSQPRRNEFTGPEQRKPVDHRGDVKARHGCMTKWDGRAVYCSSYA